MAEIFNRKKALEFLDNDTELLHILLQTFLETEFSRDHLLKLITDKKLEEAASYTHRVKGAGRQLAMEKLALSGQALEDVLRKKSQGNTWELTEIFYNDYMEVSALIKDLNS